MSFRKFLSDIAECYAEEAEAVKKERERIPAPTRHAHRHAVRSSYNASITFIRIFESWGYKNGERFFICLDASTTKYGNRTMIIPTFLWDLLVVQHPDLVVGYLQNSALIDALHGEPPKHQYPEYLEVYRQWKAYKDRVS